MILFSSTKHPFLIRGAEDRIVDDAAAAAQKALTPGERIYRQIDYAKLTGDQLVKSSGKFVLLSKVRSGFEKNASIVLLAGGLTAITTFHFPPIVSYFPNCTVVATRSVEFE